MKSSNAPERVYVAVDVMTLWYIFKEHLGPGKRVHYDRLISLILRNRRSVDRQLNLVAYTITVESNEDIDPKTKQSPKNIKFINLLKGLGYTVKNRSVNKEAGLNKRQLATDWVVGISIDAVHEINTYDTFCLVSGCGDYTMLVNTLKEKGKYVEAVVPRDCEPHILVGKADRVIHLTNREIYVEDWVSNGEHSQKPRTH